MEEELTQPATQNVVDPRREGKNVSGLAVEDISDVICILTPCSPAAYRLVVETAARAPQHVLQDAEHMIDYEASPNLAEEEKETFIIDPDTKDNKVGAADLALRFSSKVVQPRLGFVFGRNSQLCDIIIASEAHKRVSNTHFCIYINESGVLMLQDMSTNGTMVEDRLLKYRADSVTPPRLMLNSGNMIQIVSPIKAEIIKFIVRMPSRDGYLAEYEAKFRTYMKRQAAAQEAWRAAPGQNHGRHQIAPAFQAGAVGAPLIANQFGMHWTGGTQYNVVGHVGKGAFANVYQVALKSNGTLYAAKELEKRKFMKNGILDRKLDNEMTIMRAINHPNIVQYIDYQDAANHLYIIMEYVPNGDLQQYLTGSGSSPARGPLPEKVARRMADQVFHALDYLHEQRITHRDIKPDNILIADVRPEHFTVKLSDFGLSKVVKDNDTFLKTFCGTLLYCAPEVFPHYDTHSAGKGTKRPRKTQPQQHSLRSYSQAVDIWSFGAVLWYALCLKPPFEGVADKDGRGMFDKIMGTPLDVTDIMRQRVSDQAVALLVEMMNTDPTARPSPYDCLLHPWFERTDALPSRTRAGLLVIEEEDGTGAAEPDMSQLSLAEQLPSHRSEVSLDSSDLEFFQSKRFKSNAVDYLDQESVLHSSGNCFAEHASTGAAIVSTAPTESVAQRPPKLFGEISRSDLLTNEPPSNSTADNLTVSQKARLLDNEQSSIRGSELKVNSPSLLGAEEGVRDMNMDSPFSSKVRNALAQPPASAQSNLSSAGHRASGSEAADVEVTPKAPQQRFDRRINLPITASYFYDASDPSTHNAEYASKVSGHDFVNHPIYLRTDHLAPTTQNSAANSNGAHNSTETPPTAQLTRITPPIDSPHIPRCYGRLIAASDSFAPITLELHQRVTSWGRAPSNTIIYPDQADTRVPKSALTVYFWAPKLKDEDAASLGSDWFDRPDLYTGIITHASAGIWINGVALKKGEGNGQTLWGRLHTGDEVVVCSQFSDGSPGMRFICELYYGVGRHPRPSNGPMFKVETAPSNPKYAQYIREKSKEKAMLLATTAVSAPALGISSAAGG